MYRIFLAIIAVCIGIWLRRRRQHYMFFKRLNIPGPEPNIICGNVLEMKWKNPVAAQAGWIKKYGKVLGYFNGYRPILLVADADLLSQIMIKDFSDFVDRSSHMSSRPPPSPDDMALTMAVGRQWKELRSVMTPAFTVSKLKMMSPQMTESIETLIDIISKKSQAGEEFDIYEHYQGLTIEIICRTAFGVQDNFQENLQHPLLDAVKRLFQYSYSLSFILIVSFPQIMVFGKVLREVLLRTRNRGRNPLSEIFATSRDIMKLRRKDASARRPDLLQHLLDAQHPQEVKEEHLAAGDEADKHAESESAKADEVQSGVSSSKKALDDAAISMNTFVILAAGYETTSNTLASATLQLVNHQDIQEKVRKEIQEITKEEGKLDYAAVQKMKYLDCVISETLRLYPPIHSFVTRQAATDKQYGSVKIPKGLLVQVAVKPIQEDPDYWPNPSEFNPDRFLPENKQNLHPLAFQAFGAGPRNCVGMRLAQMEMKLALARILSKFRLVAGDKTESNPPKVNVNPIISRLESVYLKAVPL